MIRRILSYNKLEPHGVIVLIYVVLSIVVFISVILDYNKIEFIAILNTLYYMQYIIYFISAIKILKLDNKIVFIANFLIFITLFMNVFAEKYWKTILDFLVQYQINMSFLSFVIYVSMLFPYFLLIANIVMWVVWLSHKGRAIQ